jgi:hypothetical protein
MSKNTKTHGVSELKSEEFKQLEQEIASLKGILPN